MTPLTPGSLATANGSIEVHRGGQGGPAPLLYLHSAQGEVPGLGMLEELATDREVVAPVFPGFGSSEGLEGIDDIEDASFHILDVLDHLDMAMCDVVGLSLGGWMGAELAVRWPERVRRLVLVNPVGLYVEGAPIREIFGRPLDELADDLFADPEFPVAMLMREFQLIGETIYELMGTDIMLLGAVELTSDLKLLTQSLNTLTLASLEAYSRAR